MYTQNPLIWKFGRVGQLHWTVNPAPSGYRGSNPLASTVDDWMMDFS